MQTLRSPFILLRFAANQVFIHRQVLYPLIWMTFLQILVLEILYFSPRFPLSEFFGPIIQKVWGEKYLHYPMNLVLLPKLYYYAQMLIYVFIAPLFFGCLAHMYQTINRDERIEIKKSYLISWKQYAHTFIATILSFITFHFCSLGYGKLIARAYEIQSTQGKFFLIKNIVINGAPYVQFFLSILVTVFFVFLIPVIIIEQKKILRALIENFKIIFSSWWMSLLFVLILSMFYLPILIIRNNIDFLIKFSIPEIQVLVIILSIVFTNVINMMVIACASTYYMYKKEAA